MILLITADKKLPAGSTVAICPLTMHMDPEIFPNPEKFYPENFTPENIAKRHSYSYIPFSAGPRNCVGKYINSNYFLEKKYI